jgi:hypothetical protein
MNDIPAFPRPTSGVDQYAQTGMGLRDYFAAKAMQAMISEPSIQGTMDEFAHRAYAIADTMIKTREA